MSHDSSIAPGPTEVRESPPPPTAKRPFRIPRPGISLVWPLVLAVVVAVVYRGVLAELIRDWSNDPNYSHGFLMPPVTFYLLWKRRDQFRGLPRTPSLWGLAGVLASCAVLVLGAAGAEVFVQRVSLVTLMGSTVLFLAGWRWLRLVLFPLAFLLLAIPMPYILYYTITGPLQAFAAKCAILGLKGIGVPAMAQGNIIHLSNASLEVAEACSGIRSLFAFLAIGALLANSLTLPLAARFLVFLMTIPLSVAANAFRVWSSGLGTHVIGPEVNKGLVHELFGMIVFATAIGMFLLVRKAVKSLWPSAS